MLDNNTAPERSWQDIVAEIATATRCDHLERIADLRKELESLLDQRNQAKARSEDKLPIQGKTA